MPHKPSALIAAMPMEAGAADRQLGSATSDGVELFDLPNALVAVGGIGEKFARRAAEIAIGTHTPDRLISAGVAGAISPKLKVGDVGEFVKLWMLQQEPDIRLQRRKLGACDIVGGGDASEKQELRTKYGAEVVDMEGAAVAQVAKKHGLEFAAIKSISDDASFDMPPLGRFIDENGRFATPKFLIYVALHPRWWATLGKIKKNNELATKNLGSELEHLLRSGQ